MDDTTVTATFPSFEIRILHREDPEGGAETIAVQLTATPSFAALRGPFGPALLPMMMPFALPMSLPLAAAGASPATHPMAALWAAPMRAWADTVQAVWAPWLAAFTPSVRR